MEKYCALIIIMLLLFRVGALGMDDFSEDIKKEFDKQFKNIEDAENKSNKFKIKLLYTCFIVVFLLVLIGTVLSVSNYLKAKNNADNNIKVVEKVVVKEY